MAIEKLKAAFVDGLGLPKTTQFEALTYRGIAEWDSLGHMKLVSEIETAFEIMLETQDVLDMSSFLRAQEILGKYGVTF